MRYTILFLLLYIVYLSCTLKGALWIIHAWVCVIAGGLGPWCGFCEVFTKLESGQKKKTRKISQQVPISICVLLWSWVEKKVEIGKQGKRHKKSQNQVLPLNRELISVIIDFKLPFYLFIFNIDKDIDHHLFIVIYIEESNLHSTL